uniref:NR LBD domain-containing protein n=1 Tax=Strongyloides venezuelensis TaxID=75913 RepID=A0A0K0EYM9_STRVS
MDALYNSGVVFNLDDDEAIKLIKILIHHSKSKVDTPRTRALDEVNNVLELSSKIKELEENLARSLMRCPIVQFKTLIMMMATLFSE